MPASHRLQSRYRAVGDLNGPAQIQQRGYLPSAKQDDAGYGQRDKAHPACFGCSSLALVQEEEDYVTMSTPQVT